YSTRGREPRESGRLPGLGGRALSACMRPAVAIKGSSASSWRSGRVVDGSGLENRSAKAPGVRIPPPPPGKSMSENRRDGRGRQPPSAWRGDRVAEGARLLSECTVKNGTAGSNPALSAVLLLTRRRK